MTVGIVVIGRNEGQRLPRCLESVLGHSRTVVYVDSASTDDSVAIAREHGVDVIVLDDKERLSAARGRNAGFSWLADRVSDLEYVQFVDGDTVLEDGWLEAAERTLATNPSAAAVSGRLRELNPSGSVYNALCDMEWAQPEGEVEWCGGIAMMRASAFRDVGGFDPTLIAGEEPDLCARLRARGHRILSVGRVMAFHDAAMMHFSQWWQRNVRAGHAYGEALVRRPDDPAMRAREQVKSIALWGVALPAVSALLAPATFGGSLLLPVAGYPALAARVYRRMRRRGFAKEQAGLYAGFCVLGKFPQAYGWIRYEALRRGGRASGLIEHKRPG